MVLSAEAKIHMSLDDIIKLDRPKAGISANLTPTFHRRHRSQQWRLGRNGPGTPRYGLPWRQWRPMPINTFVARKLQNAPPDSVFHRLGWTTQGVANYKLRKAKHTLYNRGRKFRPNRSGFWGRRPFPFVGPQRAQAMYNRILATRQHFSGYGIMSNQGDDISTKSGTLTLNQQTLAELAKTLGGSITVKEDISPEGSVITTITKRSACSVYSQRSQCSRASAVSRPMHMLDERVQRMIASMQKKNDVPRNGALYDRHAAKGVGVGNIRFTPVTTVLSTHARFSQGGEAVPGLLPGAPPAIPAVLPALSMEVDNYQ